MKNNKPAYLAFAVASVFYTSASIADDNLEKITVLGHNTNLIGSSISASEGWVGEQEISVRPLLRTGELIELVPGMVATQHSGSGKANQYFLRGFNLDHGTDFATFVDGMPVNMRTHGHGQGYTDINFLIPEMVSSMAYKKGPYYAQTGDFSGAGSAFFSLRQHMPNGLAKVTLGEDAYMRMLVANSHQNVADGELLYAVEKQFYDGPWSDIDEDVNKTNVLIKHTSKVANGQLSLSFMGYDNSWNSADQIPQRAVETGIIDELGSIDKTLGGESSRYSFSANWDAKNAALSAYVIDYDLNLFSNFTYFLDDAVNGDQFEQVDDRRIYGASGHYHFYLSNTSRSTIGFETRFDDIGEVGLYKTTQKIRRGAVRSDAVDEKSAAVYLQQSDDWNDKFRTNIGVRYDYYRFDVDSLIDSNINNVLLGANNGNASEGLWSIKGSATYQLSENSEVYLASGQGFHSNDARGTTTIIDPNDGSAIDPVDPLVKSHGSEIGYRFNWQDKLNTSIALWRLTLDSELLFVGDAGNTEASRPSRRQGIELTSYFRPNKQWTFDAEYTYTQAEFTDQSEDGNDVPGALRDVIQLGATTNLDNDWQASMRVRYFGSRPLIEDNSQRAESSTIVNVLVVKHWQDWALSLEVLNLLDSNDHDIDYYYGSRLSQEQLEGVDDLHYHPMEPRTVRLTAQYHF